MSLAVIHRNEVTLVGRLSVDAAERTLPSGDVVVSWRVVVQRPPDPSRTAVTVDSIDCVARTAALGRRALTWLPGDVMEMTGALRRRFWRGGDGVRSRYEVEVATARRLAKAGANGGGQNSCA
ncbi:MAG: single-stranded DNA-binding protein [Geodermatophilaceae bacterium]|nr:single-stranded DNA-binding protein [Geodermatophilaceae bacterium]